MLRIRNFSKSYSGNLIIAVPSQDFTKGIYWIKGENGSGKTTFFKSLGGLIPCEGISNFRMEFPCAMLRCNIAGGLAMEKQSPCIRPI